jgi:hypothetical protein
LIEKSGKGKKKHMNDLLNYLENNKDNIDYAKYDAVAKTPPSAVFSGITA